MSIETIPLSLHNGLAGDYIKGREPAARLFVYRPFEPEAYRTRLQWLRGRIYPHRNLLADELDAYNREIGNHPNALLQIDKLRKPDTFVVIGGQQAGVLTGPLYTIHKAVFLLQTAQKLQKELQVEVVPVFWIAGEDHDLEEINHVYLQGRDGSLKKWRMDLPKRGRVSASMLPVAPEEMVRFAQSFFDEHMETAYTSQLRELVFHAADHAHTLVDWFARIMAALFGKYGLVFVESSRPQVRKLEQPVFRQVIQQHEAVNRLLSAAEEVIRGAGYVPQLSVDEKQAHVFLYEAGERLLLEHADESFRTKTGSRSFSQEELLRLLDAEPERFSANVVTRPLMQEHLFPTLAFVGGPGEIAYWAYYKDYFAHFGYQLPIVLPRTSVTLVEGAICRLLEQFDLKVETVLQDFAGWKQRWLQQLPDGDLSGEFARTKGLLRELYQPLVDKVTSRDQGLKGLAEVNMKKLLAQVDFLQQRYQQSVLARHELSLKRIERIGNALLPGGLLQERTYTIFSYMNKYGLDLIDRLIATQYACDGSHTCVNL